MGNRDLDAERRRTTLDELEGVKTPASAHDTHLVAACDRLRRKPIGEFSVEDLRIMIGQSIGLFFLVPLALEALERDPLAEGDFYPGDLLCSLLRADRRYWQRHSDQRARLDQIIATIPEVPEEVASDLAEWQSWTA